MPRAAVFLAPVVAVLCTTAAAAQHAILDLVPAEPTLAAIAIQNIDELIKKGDKFIEETKFNVPFRPSELFRQGVQFLGVQGGLDEKGSLGILLLRPEGEKEEIGLGNLEELLLAALPVGDLDKLAAAFGLKAAELKAGKVIASRQNHQFVKFVYLRDKHLYIAANQRPLERVAKSKPLSGEVDGELRKSLQQSDILLHFAPKGIFREWKNVLAEIEKELPKGEDPAEEKALKQLIEAMASIRFASGGFRLDDGLSMTLAAVFPKEGAAPELLASLRAGKRASDLTGLPEGNLVVAQANAGDGGKTLLIARAIIGFLFKNILETRQIISATDRPNFVGVFSEVWQRLQGSRFGVYLTSDETKRGLFSVVAMLDADDAKKFIADMKTLTRIADGSVLDLEKKPKGEEIDVNQLITDLGSKTYRVRESAGTRLRLLGEPALSYLEKAMKDGKDLEVVRRAERLWSQINTSAAQRRKELLAKDLPPFIRPSFAFVPAAETRAGYGVHIVKIKLAEKDAPIARHMEQLLGPEWDQLRLALHGNQIVVLLGSELELFDAALMNLKDGKPGLAKSKALSTFNRQVNPGRLAELHMSAERLLALTSPQRVPVTSSHLSSFALTTETSRLQLDVFLPMTEVRRIVKANPF